MHKPYYNKAITSITVEAFIMTMKQFPKNMGNIDRTIRILTGLAMVYFGVIDQSLIGNATISYIVGAFGVISIAFAYASFCPIYTLGNISTSSALSETDKE